MNEKNIKRIVVALDPSEVNRSILQAATSLASQFDAELNALFVEDINLLKLAELPFARELAYGAQSGRQINFADMERAIHMQASRLRKMVESIAQQQKIKIAFDVLRGDVAKELCSASQQTDLLIVGKSTQQVRHSRKIGRVTRTVLTSVNCNLLLLQHGSVVARPVAVLYTGNESGRRALQLAIQLAQRDHKNLVVVFPSCSTEIYKQLQDQVSGITQEFGLEATIVQLQSNTADSIIDVLETSGAKVFLIESENQYIDEKQLLYLIANNKIPVLLSPKNTNV